MAEAKMSERTISLKKVKELCKEFGFTAYMPKGALAEGRKKMKFSEIELPSLKMLIRLKTDLLY